MNENPGPFGCLYVRAVASKTGQGTTGFDLDAPSARSLAALVENLAQGTAADHQAFADAIRADAELIDPQQEAEAS